MKNKTICGEALDALKELTTINHISYSEGIDILNCNNLFEEL